MARKTAGVNQEALDRLLSPEYASSYFSERTQYNTPDYGQALPTEDEPSQISEMWRQFKGGIQADIPAITGRTLDVAGEVTGIPALEKYGEGLTQRNVEQAKSEFAPNPQYDNMWTQAARSLAPSLATAGAGIVGAIGASTLGVGAAGATAIGILSSAVGMSPLGVSVFKENYDKYIEAGHDEATAQAAAIKQAAWELGPEVVGNIPYIGLAAKLGVKQVAKEGAEVALKRLFPELGKTALKTYPAEIGTEMATAYGQTTTDNDMLAPEKKQDVWENMKQSGKVAAAMTTLMGPLSGGMTALDVSGNNRAYAMQEAAKRTKLQEDVDLLTPRPETQLELDLGVEGTPKPKDKASKTNAFNTQTVVSDILENNDGIIERDKGTAAIEAYAKKLAKEFPEMYTYAQVATNPQTGKPVFQLKRINNEVDPNAPDNATQNMFDFTDKELGTSATPFGMTSLNTMPTNETRKVQEASVPNVPVETQPEGVQQTLPEQAIPEYNFEDMTPGTDTEYNALAETQTQPEGPTVAPPATEMSVTREGDTTRYVPVDPTEPTIADETATTDFVTGDLNNSPADRRVRTAMSLLGVKLKGLDTVPEESRNELIDIMKQAYTTRSDYGEQKIDFINNLGLKIQEWYDQGLVDKDKYRELKTISDTISGEVMYGESPSATNAKREEAYQAFRKGAELTPDLQAVVNRYIENKTTAMLNTDRNNNINARFAKAKADAAKAGVKLSEQELALLKQDIAEEVHASYPNDAKAIQFRTEIAANMPATLAKLEESKAGIPTKPKVEPVVEAVVEPAVEATPATTIHINDILMPATTRNTDKRVFFKLPRTIAGLSAEQLGAIRGQLDKVKGLKNPVVSGEYTADPKTMEGVKNAIRSYVNGFGVQLDESVRETPTEETVTKPASTSKAKGKGKGGKAAPKKKPTKEKTTTTTTTTTEAAPVETVTTVPPADAKPAAKPKAKGKKKGPVKKTATPVTPEVPATETAEVTPEAEAAPNYLNGPFTTQVGQIKGAKYVVAVLDKNGEVVWSGIVNGKRAAQKQAEAQKRVWNEKFIAALQAAEEAKRARKTKTKTEGTAKVKEAVEAGEVVPDVVPEGMTAYTLKTGMRKPGQKATEAAAEVMETADTINDKPAESKVEQLTEKQRNFVGTKIIELGSIDAVNKFYTDDSAIARYARGVAEIYYGGDINQEDITDVDSAVSTAVNMTHLDMTTFSDIINRRRQGIFASSKISNAIQDYINRISSDFKIGKSIYVVSMDELESISGYQSFSRYAQDINSKGKVMGKYMYSPIDNVHVIALNNNILKSTKLISTLSHEIGHMLVQEHLKNADVDTQQAIAREYNDWLKKENPELFNEYATEIQALFKGTPEAVRRRLDKLGKSAMFDEWVAQQIAKHLINNYKVDNTSIIDKFFSKLAATLDLLRKMTNKLSLKLNTPNESVVQWLEGVAKVNSNNITDNIKNQTDTMITQEDIDISQRGLEKRSTLERIARDAKAIKQMPLGKALKELTPNSIQRFMDMFYHTALGKAILHEDLKPIFLAEAHETSTANNIEAILYMDKSENGIKSFKELAQDISNLTDQQTEEFDRLNFAGDAVEKIITTKPAGISEEAFKAYTEFRKWADSLSKRMEIAVEKYYPNASESEKNALLESIQSLGSNIKGMVPRVRQFGKWRVDVNTTLPNGKYTNIYTAFFDTEFAAKRRMEELKANPTNYIHNMYKGLKYDIAHHVSKDTEYVKEKKNLLDKQQALNMIIDEAAAKSEGTPDTTAFKKALINVIKKDIMLSHSKLRMMPRASHLITGHEETDVLGKFNTLVSTFAHGIAKYEYAQKQFENLAGVKPENRTWAKTFVKSTLEPDHPIEQYTRKISRVAVLFFLGGSIRSAVVNATQNYINGWTALYKRDIDASKAVSTITHNMMRATQYLSLKALNKEDKLAEIFSADELKVLEEATNSKLVLKSYIKELSGQNERYFKKSFPIARSIFNTLMWMFSQVETVNRISLTLSAYNLLKTEDKGKFDSKAYDSAAEIVEEAHYPTSKANLPEAMRNPIVRTALTLGSYPINFMNVFMANMITTQHGGFKIGKAHIGRERLASMGMLASISVLGGLAGLPGGDELDKVMRRLLGTGWKVELEKALRSWAGDKAASTIVRGTPTMVGLDISNSINMRMPVISEMISTGNANMAFGGSLAGMTKNLVGAWDSAVNKGDYVKSFESMLPLFLGGLLKMTTELHNEGVSKTKQDKVQTFAGKPLKQDKADIILKGLTGFKTAEQGLVGNVRTAEYEAKQYWAKEKAAAEQKFIKSRDIKVIQEYNKAVLKSKNPLATPIKNPANLLRMRIDKKAAAYEKNMID